MSEFALSGKEVEILRLLAKAKKATGAQLVRKHGILKGTAYATLHKLARKGLVSSVWQMRTAPERVYMVTDLGNTALRLVAGVEKARRMG